MSKWNELQPLDRWQPQMKSSWALRAFKQYDTEFKRLFASFTSARKYTYSHLKTDGASFTDKASVFFKNSKQRINSKKLVG